MNDWWKNPVLQGPDNEYGEYDYLIEELPSNCTHWELTRYKNKCDSCGNERHLFLRSINYFYTLDGYDCMDYNECWVCRLKDKVWSVKHKIKKEIKIVKDAWELSRMSATGNFRYYYKFVKEMNR